MPSEKTAYRQAKRVKNESVSHFRASVRKKKDSGRGLASLRRKTYGRRSIVPIAISLISVLLVIGTLIPAIARASVLSVILNSIKVSKASAEGLPQQGDGNVQTMTVLQGAMNSDPAPDRGGGGITIVDDSALVPEEGPSGTIADIEKPKNSTISRYVVRGGDTISEIAQMFNVPVSTILWANDLTKSSQLHAGQELVILPVPGIIYTVKRGDTLASIAKATGGDVTEIASYNGIEDGTVAVGAQLIIPNGEAASATAKANGSKTGSGKTVRTAAASCGRTIPLAGNPNEPSHNVGPVGTCDQISYYSSPLSHYTQTQGIHGYNAVDLAAPMGTPILAAASGEVTLARAGGWNGGYGSYVVISHGNGSQTLYGHMSKVAVYDGQNVVKGQVIGYVGSSGSSTGPHVHFEIRNGIRNPF